MNDYSIFRSAKALIMLAEETDCTVEELIDNLIGTAWNDEEANSILEASFYIDDPDDD